MFWFIGGGYTPVSGPFCVHAAQTTGDSLVAALACFAPTMQVGLIVDPVAAADCFTSGPAAPTGDESELGLAFVGQTYTPGIAALTNGKAASEAACEDD